MHGQNHIKFIILLFSKIFHGLGVGLQNKKHNLSASYATNLKIPCHLASGKDEVGYSNKNRYYTLGRQRR